MVFNFGRLPGFRAVTALLVILATTDGFADSRAPLTLAGFLENGPILIIFKGLSRSSYVKLFVELKMQK